MTFSFRSFLIKKKYANENSEIFKTEERGWTGARDAKLTGDRTAPPISEGGPTYPKES